jgi:hypothetical protein|tara:strand:+ start:1827 stop:1931 length:105 start_codon:yes stop_codon:yes gene_type:complete
MVPEEGGLEEVDLTVARLKLKKEIDKLQVDINPT